MKASTKTARMEAKKLIDTYGTDILNMHITEVVNRTGVTHFEMQNALHYWAFRKSGKTYDIY